MQTPFTIAILLAVTTTALNLTPDEEVRYLIVADEEMVREITETK